MIKSTGDVVETIDPDPTFVTMIGEPSYTMAKTSIGDITVYDGNERYRFEPMQDITPYESVKLMQMFVLATVPSITCYDYVGFIKKNGLERHFEKTI